MIAFYDIASFLVVLLALLAVVVAKIAMSRGLRYSAMTATLWALVIMGGARLWHFIREVIELEEWAEILEYGLYIIAYVAFISLVLKLKNTPSAKSVRLKEGV